MSHEAHPGCFGHATTHDPQDETCSACSFNGACSERALASRQRLERLLAYRSDYADAPKLEARERASDVRRKAARESEVLDASESTETVCKQESRALESAVADAPAPSIWPETSVSAYFISGMSKKATELHERLVRKGIDLKKALYENHMIPDVIPAFVARACEALVRTKKLDKSTLAGVYRDELGWSIGTASSHVSIIWSLFVGIGLMNANGESLL